MIPILPAGTPYTSEFHWREGFPPITYVARAPRDHYEPIGDEL